MELIPIDKELSDFKSHLEINKRTIFSAKFGDGKTFFLNEFKKLYKNDYYFITLYPINYSIADNQDIFEYIKRDILFQLAKDGKLNPIDFEGIANSIFTLENLKEVISFLISCLPKGEILNKILEKGETFAKKYKEEQTTFKKYESWFIAQKGGLYEHDGYTDLIIETLKNIKESGYKTALIIEDLDRIDPEHIFRILNILSVHDDFCRTNEHKFKFDKTILVCDIENIRKIFHAKYGADVDFSGYIDKFYSKEIFYFNNEYEIAKCVANQVLRIKVDADLLNINNFANSCFVFILQNLIKFGQINIRTLEKLPFYYNISSRKISEKNRTFYVLSSPSMAIFELLRQILGTESKLSSALLSLSNKKMYINTYDRPEGFFDVFIALADYPKNKLTEINTYSYRGIEYKLNERNNTIAQINYSTIDYLNVDYFKTLYDAYSNYRLYFT